MKAADTSSFIAYFGKDSGKDVEALSECLAQRSLCLPPVVLTELLSAPGANQIMPYLQALPLLLPDQDFWRRAAKTRARILKHGLKARLADTLICQSCLDANVALITRDADFRHYAKWAGLKLVV